MIDRNDLICSKEGLWVNKCKKNILMIDRNYLIILEQLNKHTIPLYSLQDIL